ncbi:MULTISPECIES: hypothetical protein [unclassified Streptomyces]|uniref:hypothetical protein n=1 Tax=unclassified Streptomyces TaxID=2593676 RepID=UPI000F46BA63|nr:MULTISPECIES: hypothetical protein [unclassified Streptomyces]
MSLVDRQSITLLEWLEELVHDSDSEVVDAEMWAMRNGVPEAELRSLVHSLVDGGYLKDLVIDQGCWVSLAPAGVAELQAIRAKRTNRLERNTYARNVVLQWLYDHEEERVRSLAEMIKDPQVHFYGDALTSDETGRAFSYLREQSMVRARRAFGGDVLTPRITARGIACVESGKTVADFTNPQHSGGNVYNTYLPNAQGVIVGEQQNFTQNNNAGIDPSAFIRLAGYLGQVSATLGLEDSERIELERAAQELHAAATSASPEPGRLQALTSRIVDGLTNAAGTIAGQIALQMGQDALGSLG